LPQKCNVFVGWRRLKCGRARNFPTTRRKRWRWCA
jgi:hypothetical protein